MGGAGGWTRLRDRRQRAPCADTAAGTRAAASVGGTAALTVRELGRGRVIVSGIAWDPDWSAWPRRAAFVPMLLALPAVPGGLAFATCAAGGPLALPLAETEEAELRGDDGAPLWRGPGARLTAAPALPGLFTVVQGTNR